jgi:hypothetical protein
MQNFTYLRNKITVNNLKLSKNCKCIILYIREIKMNKTQNETNKKKQTAKF